MTAGNPSSRVRTEQVTNRAQYAASTTNILLNASWTNGSISAFLIQPDACRNFSFTSAPVGGNMIGTATFNGLDANGNSSSEIFTINDAVPTTHTGAKAFAALNSIVIDRSDATNSRFSVGLGELFGIPNYPLTLTTDVFKASVNGVNIAPADFTVNAANGTINCSSTHSTAAGDVLIYWVKLL